jgi:hypothetical protein
MYPDDVCCTLLHTGLSIVDKPTTVQQGGVGLGYARVMQAKGKQDKDRRRVTEKTDT